MNTSQIIRVIVVGILVFSMQQLPVSFYEILRVAVTGAMIYLIYHAFKIYKTNFTYLYILIAVIFNPLIPFYLDKDTWIMIDILFGISLIISLIFDKGAEIASNLVQTTTPDRENLTENPINETPIKSKQTINWSELKYPALYLGGAFLFALFISAFSGEDEYEPMDWNVQDPSWYEQGELDSDYEGNQLVHHPNYDEEDDTNEKNSAVNKELENDEKDEQWGESEGAQDYSQNEQSFNHPDSGEFFTLGSTKEDVQRIMGTPLSIYESLDTWGYGLSSIDFDGNNKVIGWNNYNNTLKVKLAQTTPSNSFTLGSSIQEVVNAMGTPSIIYDSLNTWNYGLASIDFDQNHRVMGWNNYNNTLKVQLMKTGSSSSFMLGSTKQDVVNVMGTPSTIYDSLNTWNYGFGSIDFDTKDRVIGWNDYNGILKIQ